MVTLNDIAQSSGYSPATISRLFKNDPTLSIRPQSKKIIFDTAMQLGYPLEKINFAFDRVLLLYWISENEELQDEYFLEMHQQLDQFARNKHFSLTILRKGKLDPHYLRTYDAFIAVGSFSMLNLEILEKNSNTASLLKHNIFRINSIQSILTWNISPRKRFVCFSIKAIVRLVLSADRISHLITR